MQPPSYTDTLQSHDCMLEQATAVRYSHLDALTTVASWTSCCEESVLMIALQDAATVLVQVQLGNALVSLRRLTQYLVMEERNDTVEQMDLVGLEVQGGQFYWSEPPATKKLEGVKGAPGQGKKRSLLSVFGGVKLRKGPAVGTGPAKGSGTATAAAAEWLI